MINSRLRTKSILHHLFDYITFSGIAACDLRMLPQYYELNQNNSLIARGFRDQSCVDLQSVHAPSSVMLSNICTNTTGNSNIVASSALIDDIVTTSLTILSNQNNVGDHKTMSNFTSTNRSVPQAVRLVCRNNRTGDGGNRLEECFQMVLRPQCLADWIRLAKMVDLDSSLDYQ